MTLSTTEQSFLARQPLGHLSTVGRDGVPQVKPVGFTYNADTGTIDIAGFNMGRSAKFRNIVTNPRVAFVVDEVTEQTMEGAHFLEIRGLATPIVDTGAPDHFLAPEIIRIHPTRVVAYNIDRAQPGLHVRDLELDPPG
jgi:pyridoxamine 5'-phosphate oxidase family protein